MKFCLFIFILNKQSFPFLVICYNKLEKNKTQRTSQRSNIARLCPTNFLTTMTLRVCISVFLFHLAIGGVYAQYSLDDFPNADRRNFSRIQKALGKMPSASTQHVGTIAQYITIACSTPLDKAYGAYYWIAGNITYDMQSFLAKVTPPHTPEEVLKTKSAVCSGYAFLFQAVCKRMGIPCTVVHGYSKGYGYNPAQGFSISNHSWNVIELNGRWYPVDVTWAAPNNNNTSGTHHGKVSTDYFLRHPKLFAIDHLPEDPKWQLLSPTLSLPIFEKGQSEISNETKFSLVVNEINDHYTAYSEVAVREVALQQRILDFNPKNKSVVYKLGVALLYQALDTMETMHNLAFENVIEALPKYKYRVYELLNQAAFHFKGVPATVPEEMYTSAQTFLSETTYQKAVFNYEAAQVLFDTTTEIERSIALQHKTAFNHMMNQYYDIAIDYFKQIDTNSWYYESSLSYISSIDQNRSHTMIE